MKSDLKAGRIGIMVLVFVVIDTKWKLGDIPFQTKV